MKLRAPWAYALVLLCLGMGRPCLGAASLPSASDHPPPMRACLTCVGSRQQLQRLIRLLGESPDPRVRTAPASSPPAAPAAASPPAPHGAATLRLLMRRQE